MFSRFRRYQTTAGEKGKTTTVVAAFNAMGTYLKPFIIHSFIPDIYIAPLQETYSETLSVQLRSKINVLRSLQKEDMLFRGSKRSERGSSVQIEGPITEKALRCLISAERARGTKSSPRAEERRARREARSETGLQRLVKCDGAQSVTDRHTSAEILYILRVKRLKS